MRLVTRLRFSMTPWRFGLIVGGLAAALYIPTWSPVVTWAHFGEDGPELEAAGRALGIPHPTGYPLFMLLIRVVAGVLPPPWAAVNVVTVLGAVLAVIGTGFAGRALGRRAFPGDAALAWGMGAVAAAVFATSLTWWKQSVIGEVYTLHLALAAAILAVCFGRGRRRGLVAAYLLGLGCCHHLLILPLLLVILAYAVRGRPRFRDLRLAAMFLFPLTLYAVPMIRSAGEPIFDWGNPETPRGLWWMVSGVPYQGNLLAGGIESTLVRAAEAGILVLPVQIGAGGALLTLCGMLFLGKRAPREGAALGLLFAGTLIVAAAYAIPDPAAYYLPAVLAGALAAGLGWGGLFHILRRRLRAGALRSAALAALAAGLTGTLAAQVTRVGTAADATGEIQGFQYARWGVDVLDPGALVISHGDGRTFSLWYGTSVLESRPDVAVLYDNLLDWSWYREQVARNHPWVRLPREGLDLGKRREHLVFRHVGLRPLYVTDVDPFMLDRFLVVPEGPLYRLVPRADVQTAYWRSQ